MTLSRERAKRKLLLIHPSASAGTAGFGQTASWGLPPLALAYVAAVTPADTWEVVLVDEYDAPADQEMKADLVGISTYSCNILRAYELAAGFRRRGIPVVLGGIHASMLPDEAAPYADSVVIGEAESVWPQVLKDVEEGKLQPRYEGGHPSLAGLPLPRRDLFGSRYAMDVIQTTRGCPFGCEFCSVTAFNGASYRQRPVQEVLDELGSISKKLVYFVDDNFFGSLDEHRERALQLCRGMIERKMRKIWITQASLNIADHEDVLRLAYQSGCRGLYLGFEALNASTLKAMRKAPNIKLGLDGMKRAVERIHRNGMCVIGAFIFGHDTDDGSVFEQTRAFIEACPVDVPQFGYLTPFPGTRLLSRLQSEDRLIYKTFPPDWAYADTDHILFKPAALDLVEWVRGFDYVVRNVFSRRRLLWRALRTFGLTRNIVSAVLAYQMNRDSVSFYDHDQYFKLRARKTES
ncbi:MAG: radical SAM protein [Lentisphaerota bacterium]